LALSVGRWKNKQYDLFPKLLITANPKKGWMKHQFVDPYNAGTLPANKKYVQAFITDNTYLPQTYVDKMQLEQDVVRRQRLVLGNWDYDEDKDALVSYAALDDMFLTTAAASEEKYMIVDVARLGKDRIVFGFFKGLQLYRIEIRAKQSTPVTEQQIRDFAFEEKVPFRNILVDDGGVGGGVVDHTPGCIPFVSSSSPIPTASTIQMKLIKTTSSFPSKTEFGILKDQCGFKLAEMIEDRKLGVSKEVHQYRDSIIEELQELLRQKDVDTDGKRRLKPKDEVKQALSGRSPDIGDMFIMRMYFELVSGATIRLTQSKEVVEKIISQFNKNRLGSMNYSNK
jgi:phage terminase large subunit